MKGKRQDDRAQSARHDGLQLVAAHPVLAPLAEKMQVMVDSGHRYVAPDSWLAVSRHGTVWMHPKRIAEPAAWARLIGIALACLGFGLVRRQEPYVLWEITSLLLADRFCDELKLGALPENLGYPQVDLPAGGADALLRRFCVEGCDPRLQDWYAELTKGGSWFCDLDERLPSWRASPRWSEWLADGIAQGVGCALQVASGALPEARPKGNTPALRARQRLIDHYPLLGALAASFDLEQDTRLCQQYAIRVAAIDVGARRIWINPAAGLNEDESVFVFAHELLHAGLNHASRRRGRDRQLWNVACDFVINGWLIEMRVGTPPSIGMLHDAKLTGQSAEDIYDGLATDMRRARKLATLRGVGEPDLIGEDQGRLFTDTETWCRRALAQGLDRCACRTNRGTIPAGLIEEIRSLSQPPIPWDVKLAQWFDERFPPPELRRGYARPSRRQSATLEMPRPSLLKPSEEERRSRVFGVLLDTSGSMEPQLLGKALGAIASYALARDVIAVRLICCDAAAYDSGWVEPQSLLDRFTLRGRGGTVLQPGLDQFAELAARGEFPRHGPLLVITDGYCEETIRTAMDHAFLLPEGRRLPFRAQGDIFQVS